MWEHVALLTARLRAVRSPHRAQSTRCLSGRGTGVPGGRAHSEGGALGGRHAHANRQVHPARARRQACQGAHPRRGEAQQTWVCAG